LPAPRKKTTRPAPVADISARLRPEVRLEAHANGAILAFGDGYPTGLGVFGTAAADCVQKLRTGLRVRSLGSVKEIELLVRRLAGRGLLEYSIACPAYGTDDLIVIEPQTPAYWPKTPEIGDNDALVLSRFAYMRRRGDEMVLESPRADAVFKFCDPKLACLVAMLAAPRQISQLQRQPGYPGVEFLALLVACQILLKADPAGENNARLEEGDPTLMLWDFHDLLFHARSTEGRHAGPIGGTYPHGSTPPPPAERPPWPGKKIDLCTFLVPPPEPVRVIATLLRERHSTRSFDDRQPVTIGELSRFLDGTTRHFARTDGTAGFCDSGPSWAAPPYPSAGASYELELYLAVNRCEGLAPGFYTYNAAAHALSPIEVSGIELKALLERAAHAMGVTAAPQILITVAARFSRVSWKYSSIAYSLILKDTGVLTQTFYLMAAAMGLGGCAIGIVDIEQFAAMTGIGFHIEGPVGQFALGRERVD
jgi:SagB-type dehydrogenase family enzyme